MTRRRASVAGHGSLGAAAVGARASLSATGTPPQSSAMRIITDRVGMARLATAGRSAMEANQSLTCSTVMASTAKWPKAGRIYLRTI